MDHGGPLLCLSGQALSGRESAARTRLTEELAERARSGENRQALLDEILVIALDLAIADADVGGLVPIYRTTFTSNHTPSGSLGNH